MHVESIPDTDAQMSIAEIFLANGKLPEARHHLEILAAQAPDSTRVSYYRGILAQLAGEPGARDFFVDALLDPFLSPRAAVQLGNGRRTDPGHTNDPGRISRQGHSKPGGVPRADEGLQRRFETNRGGGAA
jgi:hypothetical protein